MFLHPSNLLFFTLMVMSIFLILSAESWLSMWIFLEINLLIFIPLLFEGKSKYQSESALKYFMNQAMSSVLILSCISFTANSETNMSLVLMAAFSLKMGVAPLHGWLVSVAGALSWKSLWLLLMPQKVAPMIILETLINKETFLFLTLMIFVSSIVGALGGLTTPSMKKIITFSSISQSAWLLSALLISSSLWLFYFMIYFGVVTVIVCTLLLMKINKVNDLVKSKQTLSSTLMMMNMLSLAGLPPFSGFMIKLMMILALNQTQIMLLVPLILSSLVSLFFYSRIFYMSFLCYSHKKMISYKQTPKKMIILMNILAMPLGLAVYM